MILAIQRPQVTSDGITVWVNAPSGECIGRFGRQGIDVHRTIADQIGLGECLHCTHAPTTAADWDTFVEKMQEHHGVKIARQHRPKRFACAN